jgi:hypothetical protein
VPTPGGQKTKAGEEDDKETKGELEDKEIIGVYRL